MKKPTYITWIAVAVLVVIIGFFVLRPLLSSKQVDNPIPAKSIILSEGDFTPSAHDVAGKALLVSENGKQTVRFEDFNTINGPDLRIYLSKGLDVSDAIDLGAIKATQGNVNYDVPAGVNAADYPYVLVWCRAFHVLFSYSKLS